MNRMNCISCKEKLSAYVDDELAPPERVLMKEHLQVCHSCAEEAEALYRMTALMGSIFEETPSRTFVEKTVHRAAAIQQRSFRKMFSLASAFSFIRNVAVFVFAPGTYGADGENRLSSHGYLRSFDDSPPGSFADVYLTLIQGGGN